MQLCYSTWSEVEAYLQQRDDLLIPVGATEQHGPYGLIGTDQLCAAGVAAHAGRRGGILVGPTLQVGMSLHHLAFPGSMSLRPQTMMAVIEDWASSLAGHGFRHLRFVNGHGGNVSSLQAAFSAVSVAHPQLRCRLSSWYELSGVQALIEEHLGAADGAHGTPSELSLAFALHPEQTRVTAPQPPAPADVAIYSAEDLRRRYPDGRIGADQHLADPDLGRRLLEAAVTDLLVEHEAWLTEG